MVESKISNSINYFDQQYKTLNQQFNCFTLNLSDFARSNIKNISDNGLLAGKLIAIKDNINIKGFATTCSSQILKNHHSIYNATVINRIINEEGLIVAKTNMDEFAMGSSNEHSIFGPVSNPIDVNKVSGGSSGGSDAAVASGVIDIALGSDTGGSVRQPAAFCGVYGLKPTYGRISRYGLTAFASSLDQIGIFSRNTNDIVDMFQAIGGHDAHDSNTSKLPLNCDYTKINTNNLTIGYSNHLFNKLNPDMRKPYDSLIDFLKLNNIKVKNIDIDLLDLAIPTYYIIATAEASSNLSRFDGIRYGQKQHGHNVHDLFTKTRSKFFGEEVKRRIMLGTYVLSSGYYDAYYKKALKIRKMITNSLVSAFSDCDLLILPTTPTPAFNKQEKINDSLGMYLSDIFTVPISLAGLPAMSIPIGEVNGLPIGAQLCANYFHENNIFSFSKFIEDKFT